MPNSYHSIELNDVCKAFSSGDKGLTSTDAKARLATYGENKLGEGKKLEPLKMLLAQFTNLMIVILIAAAIVSGFLGEWTDAGVILAIVVLNGILGFVQEYKAEKALEALKKLTVPQAKVLRDGEYK